jgi:hypothetical protein
MSTSKIIAAVEELKDCADDIFGGGDEDQISGHDFMNMKRIVHDLYDPVRELINTNE